MRYLPAVANAELGGTGTTNQLITAASVDSDGLLATCCLISLDLRSGGGRIVRAGHPLPVLRRADGAITELGKTVWAEFDAQ